MSDGGHSIPLWLLTCGHVAESDRVRSYLHCPTCKVSKPVMRRV